MRSLTPTAGRCADTERPSRGVCVCVCVCVCVWCVCIQCVCVCVCVCVHLQDNDEVGDDAEGRDPLEDGEPRLQEQNTTKTACLKPANS